MTGRQDGFANEQDAELEVERRTSYLELFFDLVFVFAITQVTSLVLEDASAGGFARSAVVLGMVWWAWSGYAWMTNAIDIESPLVRGVFVVAMAGSFFMALSVPDAYRDEGEWFAGAYFAVRVFQVALYLYGLRHDPAHQAAMRQLAPWFLLAPSIALAGGLVEDPTRVTLWAVAIAVDVAGTLTVGQAGFRVSPSHFAERYALFIIIALGESIVAIGVGSAELEKDAAFAGAVAIAFAGVAALWWGYFDFAQTGAERTLRRTPAERRGALARDVFTFFHYPIVAGIILFAVAAKKTLAHPEDALSGAGRFALGAGIAVFLLGFVLARLRAIRRVAWERIGGAVAAAVLCAALTDLAGAALLAVVVAVLAAVYAFEAVRLRELRAQLRSEP